MILHSNLEVDSTRPVRQKSKTGGRNFRMFALILPVIFLSGSSSMKSYGQAASNEKSLEGTWSGTLGAGAAKLRIILTILKSSAGFAGSLNSVDQGAVIPMNNIRLDGEKVHFELQPVGGVYDGVLSKDGAAITGTWIQTGVPAQPLSFQRGAGEAATLQASPTPPGPKEKPFAPQLDVVVPIAPAAFQAGGKWNLAYELHVANLDRWDYTLTRLEIVSADSAHRSLSTFDTPYLEGMITHPGQRNVTEASKLSPGSFGVVFVWITLDKREDVPATIVHRIRMKIGTYPEELSIEAPPTPVNLNPVVVISPPLEGDNWLAGNGASNTSAHRRALLALDGRSYISQRFAIDWVRLNTDGKTYQGDSADNKNYRAYGAEIHAVADGIVTEVKDGIPQNTPGPTSRAVPITLETIGGNHVIMQIGEGLYAFYAHIQPGSLRVKPATSCNVARCSASSATREIPPNRISTSISATPAPCSPAKACPMLSHRSRSRAEAGDGNPPNRTIRP